MDESRKYYVFKCLIVLMSVFLRSPWADFVTVFKREKQMAAGRVAHVTLQGPSVVKEILTGMGLALFAGSFWKMHQWNEQRKVRAFYDLLEKGEISVVVDEE